MDKVEAKIVATELMEAATAVLARHGLKPGKSGTTYNSDPSLGGPDFAWRLEGINADPAQNPDRLAWSRYAELYGLPADGLDKVVTITGTAYRITGIVPTRPKFPVKVEALASGKAMLFTVDGVKRALGIPVAHFPRGAE